MSNTTPRQRLAPSTSSASTKPKPYKRPPLDPEQKKMQLELLHTWDLQISLGVRLDAKEMSLRAGRSSTAAIQYLKGHIPLNTDACLWFARELKMAPQEIWSDWKWADLTGNPMTLNLARLWGKLEISTRSAINKLVTLNGTLRHDGEGTIIHILPGTVR
jgi:hypothetical protein